ncbi:hypothetical protein NP493_359g00020 [Ridgeia piscesae]|uniref:Transmembrane protein 260 n=1 Tax=Ridgeia piscesae TaxID=27915 RepID=A0AAD9L396_RIDPI|nr:hypothetical protein NP493_359g00020 [Ridgeia piscesae]
MKTLHPSVPGGDSGELIISANEVGVCIFGVGPPTPGYPLFTIVCVYQVTHPLLLCTKSPTPGYPRITILCVYQVAHPPGYPLFTMCAKLSMLLLPFGSPAQRVNLLNAVFSALAAAVLQLCVLRLTSGCIASSLLTTGLFALSRLTWTWSVTAEVFGLNNLFVAVLMLLVVLFESSLHDTDNMSKLATLGAFTCALALTNQHTVVVYVACIAFWVLYHLWRAQALDLPLMGHLVGAFAVGLLPYVYLPVASTLNIARWTWGDQRTVFGFVTHLLRTEKKPCQRSSVLLFVAMFGVYTGLFAWRANLDTTNPLLRGVVERFWIQSDILVAALAGIAYSPTCRWISEKCLRVDHKSSILPILGATSLITLQLTLNFHACDQSDNYVVHDFALRILESMPKDAIILSKGDLPTNSLRYFHLCENKRPDLQILDVEVLSYVWSLPMLQKFYPGIKFPGDFWYLTNKKWPDGLRSFNFASLLDANIDRRPVFVCIGMQTLDSSWHPAYQLWPYGVCERVQRSSTLFDSWLWLNSTKQFANTSWEKVANDEMWHAKIASAFFMYRQAEQLKDETSQAQLLVDSYELYLLAIRMNQNVQLAAGRDSFPSFWHRNFALVCERLLHLDHALDKVNLCKQSIAHFERYLAMEPHDSDADKIQEAIESLKPRVDVLRKMARAQEKLGEVLERRSNT